MSGNFLQVVFGQVENSFFHIWLKEPKLSHWFDDWRKANEFIGNADVVNAYAGIGLMKAPQGLHRRMDKDEVAGIVGLYTDIDIAGAGHDKAMLPPDVETAIKIISGFPFEPTIIVHSGGGLQAWWVFKEPWMFDTSAERKTAAQLSFRFNYTFKQKYNLGYTVDSIFNLDRLGRLPGTINRKEGRPDVRATIVKVNDGCYYNPDDLEEYCLPVDQIAREQPKTSTSCSDGKQVITDSGLTLDISVKPNPDVILELSMANDKFAATWKHERTDLHSASEYDFSLASIAMHAGVPDQDIVDMMIAWRRKHSLDPEKCLRADYVGVTLANVRKSINQGKADQHIQVIEASGDEEVVPKEDVIASAKEVIKTYTGLDLISLKYTYHPATEDKPSKIVCHLDTKQFGECNIGTGEALENKGTFKHMLIRLGAKFLPDIDKRSVKWREILNAFLICREDVFESDEFTELGFFKSIIPEYLSCHQPIKAKDVGDTGVPCLHSGNWWLTSRHFSEYLRTRYNLKYQGPIVASMLRNLGILSRKVDVEIDGVRTSRSYYPIPQEIYSGNGRIGSTIKLVVNNEK